MANKKLIFGIVGGVAAMGIIGSAVGSGSGSEVSTSTTGTTTIITTTMATTSQTEATTVATIPIELISVSSPIQAGDEATVTVKGLPKTKYSIAVFYSSGQSEAAGLESKVSDENGKVSWTWSVGSKTKPGYYALTITGDNQKLKVDFTVK